MTISESEFERVADKELTRLRQALDDSSIEAEVELEMGILSIEFPDGAKYIVNSHRAAKQIWMAADRSAWHFDPDLSTGKWTATKSGDELWSALEGTISKKAGKPFKLAR
ncbi:MAG: iron donor protein CyaY [Polyangiaceae bacterium]|nr:iron donor protein CyaY [Polyangiaceae bacterium]